MIHIGAIIVTYHPDFDLLRQQLVMLSDQVSDMLIVDNTGYDMVNSWVKLQAIPGVAVFANSKNLGLGAAHNIGIDWAKTKGYKYVLLLDQDSIPERDMVFQLMHALILLEKEGKNVSAVGPLCRDMKSGASFPFRRFGWFNTRRIFCDGKRDLIAVDFLITSGSLIPLKALTTTGGMNEDLFIDHVDTDWFLRAACLGMRPWGVCNAYMRHTLGEVSHRLWFFGWRSFFHNKPFRYYYIFRNSIIIWQKSYAPIKWISGDIVRVAALALSVVLFGPNRFVCVRMILSGIADGLRRKGGKQRTL